jgi:hypothetical protein
MEELYLQSPCPWSSFGTTIDLWRYLLFYFYSNMKSSRSFGGSYLFTSNLFFLITATTARNVKHFPRSGTGARDSSGAAGSSSVTQASQSMQTILGASSTQAPVMLVTQPTSSSSSTRTSTMESSSSASPRADKLMNMKFMIPIAVGTFLFGIAVALLSIFLYCRRRRLRRSLNSPNRKPSKDVFRILPSTPPTPFTQSPSSAVSPISPAITKEQRLGSMHTFGNILVHEVGAGRRTPQEVLGDTTWAKGDRSPDPSVALMSQFTRESRKYPRRG